MLENLGKRSLFCPVGRDAGGERELLRGPDDGHHADIQGLTEQSVRHFHVYLINSFLLKVARLYNELFLVVFFLSLSL